jgi:pimeloyl-ACP methyl ester carboxylesterase
MRTLRHEVDGLRLAAVHLPAQDRVVADPVVMVPGLAVSGCTLLPALRAFAAFADVWAVDLPGAGGSGVQRDDVLARAAQVACPALVLRGGRDALAPQGWAEDLAGRLPRGRLVVLPGQPHNALTLAPKPAAARVQDFLTRPGPG